MYKIYLITNLKNNKQYVGITKFSLEERFCQHIKRGFILTEAIRKYGKDLFSIELIEEVETAERAYELEIFYIEKYNTKSPNGYNLTDGGDGIFGWEATEEYRKECSERVKELHKQKKVGMYGKKHTEQTREKMKESAKEVERTWLIGRKHSPETIELLRQKNLGRKHTEETRQKIKENHHDISGENNPMYGRKHSPETIEKMKQKRAQNRVKRIWVNNQVEEKLIPVDGPIPLGYTLGRIKK
jgi:group I intron endonuclease